MKERDCFIYIYIHTYRYTDAVVKVKIQIITEGKKNGHARCNTVIAEKFFLFSPFSRLSLSLSLSLSVALPNKYKY